MRSEAPSQTNMMQLYRPPCSKCGALMTLAYVEPSHDRTHDLRTFKCEHCGNAEVVKIRL